MADTTTIVTLYDDAAKTKAFAPRTKVEAISNSSGTGLQALLDNKMALRPNYIEFGASADSTVNEGFIDWHFNGSTADYTSRIIESASGTLVVNGVSFSSNKITSGTWNGSAVGAAYGGTGQTSLINSANTLINALSTGSSTPTDADYYISQYVGGGTTTTTYHRRPMSALWTYVKGKTDSLYLPLAGGKMTGSIKFQSSSLPSKSLSYICGIDAFDSGGEMGWQSKADFLSGYATTSQLGNYLPLSGGTVTGSLGVGGGLSVAGNVRIHTATGTSGTSGYIKFATLTIATTYTNAPMMFTFGQRGKSATAFCWVQFSNANSTDPALADFKYLGFGSTYGLYIVKSATSTWDLYIAKSEAYDRMGVSFFFSSQDGINITYTNVQASSVPSGYIAAKLVCQTTSFVSSSQPTANATGDIWFVP